MLRYFDVVLLVVAAPIMLLIGVPALGYRGRRRRLDRAARDRGAGRARRRRAARTSAARPSACGSAYMLGRLFLLALAVILVRNAGPRTTA